MTYASLFVCCVLVGSSLALNSWELPQGDQLWESLDRSIDGEWMFFKKAYNKTYVDLTEEITRRVYWEDNMKFIREHNEKYKRGQLTFYLGENELTDMAEDEFRRTYLSGLIVPDLSQEVYPEPLSQPDPEAPTSVDWRQKGIVTSVKRQGSCASCWAFAAVASMESLMMKKKGTTVQENYSEQNLIDCAGPAYGNYGCRGGWANYAFTYVRHAGGIDKESCYPYRARDQSCAFKGGSCIGAKVTGHQKLGRSEYSVASNVAKVGPITVAADVNDRTFHFYKGGVWCSTACNQYYPNHAIVAVGYGVQGNQNYWIIKNSWGKTFGMEGYIYMAKNNANDCGIKNFASYPLV